MIYIITEERLQKCVDKIGADGLVNPQDIRDAAITVNPNRTYTILCGRVYEESLKEINQ